MRLVVLSILIIPALAGCTGDGGVLENIGDAFSSKKTLDGECGQAFNDGWDKQIILDVRLSGQAARFNESTVEGHDVAALYQEADPPRNEGRADTDEDGCVAFQLKDPGSHLFWAYRELPSGCFLSGYVQGNYDGETPVVAGEIVVSRQC